MSVDFKYFGVFQWLSNNLQEPLESSCEKGGDKLKKRTTDAKNGKRGNVGTRWEMEKPSQQDSQPGQPSQAAQPRELR